METENDVFIGVKYTPDEETIAGMMDAKNHLDADETREYLCEVCGAKETLTEQQAYDAGWDYPPFIGLWGVVSPRTCPNCGIESTAYWHVLTVGTHDIPKNHQATLLRILEERMPQ